MTYCILYKYSTVLQYSAYYSLTSFISPERFVNVKNAVLSFPSGMGVEQSADVSIPGSFTAVAEIS